ncbi:MAG: thiamine phosphate synthase [Bacteroidetes bacterium]|nr:thiamine phosphate synthase [Bacteroidota bacterium]
MKILISYPIKLNNEVALINELMTSGEWDLFHLRKPNYSSNELLELWNKLDNDVRKKTVLHQDFKGSCHSFEEVEAIDGQLPYCFLSPIFDSISKQGYQAKFDKNELKAFLKKKRTIKVIGLGGVTAENYTELLELGFDGGAFLGSVWGKYN